MDVSSRPPAQQHTASHERVHPATYTTARYAAVCFAASLVSSATCAGFIWLVLRRVCREFLHFHGTRNLMVYHMNKLFLCACPEHEGYTRKPAQAWPWLAFWLLQLAWLAGSQYYILALYFAKPLPGQLKWALAALTATIFCVLFAVLPLTATSLDFITTQLLAGIVFVVATSGATAWVALGDKANGMRWGLSQALLALVQWWYFWMAASVISSWGRWYEVVLLRMGVHPLVWGGVQALGRQVARNLGASQRQASSAYMLPYHQAEALWGWLLLFLMSRNIGSVLGLGVMLTLAQEAAGVLERCPDIHWTEVYYHPKAAEALAGSEKESEVAAGDALAALVCNLTGIFQGAVLLSFSVTANSTKLPELPITPLSRGSIWTTAAILAAVKLAAFIASTYFKRSHHQQNLPQHWAAERPLVLLAKWLPYLLISNLGVVLLQMLCFCSVVDRHEQVMLGICRRRTLLTLKCAERPWVPGTIVAHYFQPMSDDQLDYIFPSTS